MRSTEPFLPWSELEPMLVRLEGLILAGRIEDAYEVVRRMVPEFAPSSPIADLLGARDAPLPDGVTPLPAPARQSAAAPEDRLASS